MSGVFPKSTAGIKPPSPDLSVRPASVVQPKKWEKGPVVSPVIDLDRAQRIARSDPQGRYGNSEVARVAIQQNPTPIGARKAPAGKLPEAGPVVADAGKKRRGHGKPSANPGAAKAAVEAKHKGDQEKKKDAGKAGAKTEPGKGKAPPASGGASGGAPVDRKASKEKEGVESDGGREAASESPANAGGASADSPAAPPPPQRPRLEGTDAVVLKVPQLADQQRERIRVQTGFTLAEHYARAQVHLDRLSARAKSEQFAIVLHIELIEAEVRRDLENAQALIGPAVENGIGRVRDSCAAARADINAASKEALATVETSDKLAQRNVDATALMSKEAIDKAVLASSPQIRALHEVTMKPIREMLKRQGEAFAKAAADQGTEVGKQVKTMAPDPDFLGSDAIQQAIAERKQTIAADNIKSVNEGFVAAGQRAQQDILSKESSLSLSFLLFVNPVAVKVEHIGGADGKTVVEKGGEIRLRLATDYERAKGFVDETTKRALKALDALESSAVKQLQQMRQSLEAMAHARREQLCAGILAGQGPAAEAWAEQMKGVNDLVDGDEVIDVRRLEPRFTAAMDSMNALSARQRLDFDAQARSGYDETRAGMDEDRLSIDEAADSFIGSARDTRKQAATMRQYGGTLAKGFQNVADTAGVTATEFRTQVEEKLGLSAVDTRKQMEDLCKTTDATLKTAVKEFGGELGRQVPPIVADIGKVLAAVDGDVIRDLARRSAQLVKAMDKPGTDELGVFEALYGMTPVYGRALTLYWGSENRHVHSLWWWLDDELSGDEYSAAENYLLGDPVKGVQFQIESAKRRFWSDDVATMESGLRALSDKQLQELNNDKGFAESRKSLEKSLKGTNLLVVQALLAGRTARADALRLKDAIDAARAAGNDDKLHELLSNIDPRRLAEVRTEFLDIKAGHVMLAKAPVVPPDKEAAADKDKAAFAKYVTDPVEVWEPGMGEGDPGRYVTRTLSEPSAKLATALATTGEGSSESRAARLAYEKSRGRKPRPEKLAIALDDPDLVKARNNPILTQKDAKPEDVAEARKVLEKLEARRAEVMTKFAEMTNADEKIKKDPKKAAEYTEKAVADMFGDDELGRKLGASMVKDGRARPALAIKYAVRGWGTNEALIRKTLRGMSAAEIKDLKEDYAKLYGGEGDDNNPNQLYDDLGVFQNAKTAEVAGVSHATGGGFFTELSGDDRQEVEELLLGDPKNDRDRMNLARLKYQHQKGEGSTWVTGAVMAIEDSDAMASPMAVATGNRPPGAFASEQLDLNKARMEQMIADCGGEKAVFDKDGNFKDVPGKYKANDFRLRVAVTSEMAENYKTHVDSLVDMITGAIALIGAIVGTIVVTVLTMGTATPFVVGAWAAGIAALTGAAVMATKYALKGSRYGWEEVAVDAAMTLVDAATAGLMAGAGAKAARAATELAAIKAAARTPAAEAAADLLIKQSARKEMVRGFGRTAGSAFVGGTARQATADGTWDDGFLTGLGRSVKGGVHAAGIGLATHGASHAFSRSGLGQRLGQSTSYLQRGLGSGLGGAIGGMAGRSTELTLDVLGGHSQVPFDEALGSIALAGGRGFAENFGQGMAEVPKARRDAAHEEKIRIQKMSDAERVARFGMTSADEVADAHFARMATAAAIANDPKLNAKAFLADLNAAIANDRAVVEANRQLVHAFRHEALASIPKERRGEFEDVPIHVLPDAQFEKFTGSQSGRAVTIIIDGEAQIVVRKSATPETLREEGIHVLQSREPKWREKIARLDEKTMAKWNELDLETQLSLYKDKIDVELDAHQRLRKDLLDEADGTADPARRKALLEQAEATGETHKALKARQEEVDAIGPERLAAIKRGDEARPQYLREPARLFAKVSKARLALEQHPERGTNTEDVALEHKDDLSGQKRHEVKGEDTTWGKEQSGPGRKFYRVGDAWIENEIYKGRPRPRLYRMVEVTEMVNGVEVIVDRRREILQRKGNKRWQQRGNESTARGALFEEASRLRTLAKLEEALGRNVRPNEDLIVPIGALLNIVDQPGKPLTAQHGGGAGFDDVVFRFRQVGGELVADIVIIEAKGYRRALTLEDLSAITKNLPDNLVKLSEAVLKSNFSEVRIEAVRAAIRERRLTFALHASPTTSVGEVGSNRASILKSVVDTEEARRQIAATRRRFAEIKEGGPGFTKQEKAQFKRDVKAIDQLEARLNRAYEKEPFDPRKVHEALTEILGDPANPKSLAAIARREAYDFDLGPRRARPDLIERVDIDIEKADKPYAEAAQKSLKDKGRAAGPEIRSAGLVGSGAQSVAKAATAPVELEVVQVPGKNESIAISRPAVDTSASGESSAASVQLANLLREGAPLANGKTRVVDRVLWDASGRNLQEVAAVLEQVRKAIAPTPNDANRFSVTIDAAVTASETTLREALKLPEGTRIRLVNRAPIGTPTWIVFFDSSWMTNTK